MKERRASIQHRGPYILIKRPSSKSQPPRSYSLIIIQAVILNHADFAVTERLKKAGEVIGITALDNIIIGDGS
jgi:hypothetical protein